MANPDQTVCCLDCAATAKATLANGGWFRTPKRWRKVANGFRCPKCQQASFVGRSIRVKITGPAEGEDRDRKEMYAALNAASKASNQFANWILQRLLSADELQLKNIRGLDQTKDGKVKLPPLPKLDWYREATQLFPQCAPSSLCQQKQMIERYYGKERFAALVAMNKNVRSYRWDGLPVVVHVQSWKLLRIYADKIVLRSQIGPGKSWTLNVFAQGQHLEWLRMLADGVVIPGTAMFVRRKREPRPGEQKPVRVWYLRISAQVPRAKKVRGRGLREITLTLGHDASSLLYGALDEGDDVFDYPAPALRSLIAAHKKLDRQRQVDASYRRQGWSKRKSQRWSVGRTAACERNAKKVQAEIELAVACLVRWCESHNVTAVDYDVTPRDWMESFPYHALAQRIKTSLENAGIAFHLHGESSTGNEIGIQHAEEVSA